MKFNTVIVNGFQGVDSGTVGCHTVAAPRDMHRIVPLAGSGTRNRNRANHSLEDRLAPKHQPLSAKPQYPRPACVPSPVPSEHCVT
jgi:hypothetical protein